MHSLQLRQRLVEKVRATKVARFEGERDRHILEAFGPWHARVDLRANPENANTKRTHDRTGSLPAGHDQLSHTRRHQPLTDPGERLFDQGASPLDAELALYGLHVLRRTRRIDQDRSRSQLVLRPGKRLF